MTTQQTGFTVFDTAIGACGVAWSGRGVVGAQLPELSPEATRVRLAARFPQLAEAEPPPEIAGAILRIVALMAGARTDLSDVELDLSAADAFEVGVYEIARRIPAGATLTYGEIARRLGQPDAARAVGRALARNPIPIFVPCHRVLAAGGGFGGFSAPGGLAAKARLLTIERAQTSSAPALFEDLPIAVRPKGSA